MRYLLWGAETFAAFMWVNIFLEVLSRNRIQVAKDTVVRVVLLCRRWRARGKPQPAPKPSYYNLVAHSFIHVRIEPEKCCTVYISDSEGYQKLEFPFDPFEWIRPLSFGEMRRLPSFAKAKIVPWEMPPPRLVMTPKDGTVSITIHCPPIS